VLESAFGTRYNMTDKVANGKITYENSVLMGDPGWADHLQKLAYVLPADLLGDRLPEWVSGSVTPAKLRPFLRLNDAASFVVRKLARRQRG
jgi:hypothetical protein